MTGSQQLPQNQQVARDGNDAVGANRAMRRWPGKHQNAIKRHQFVGPDESGQSKEQVQLHNEAKDCVFHVSNTGGGKSILIQTPRELANDNYPSNVRARAEPRPGKRVSAGRIAIVAHTVPSGLTL